MDLHLDAIPSSITRDQMVAWVKQLGFSADDLRSIRVDRGGVYAETFARDENGNRYTIGGEVATHTIAIPVVDL